MNVSDIPKWIGIVVVAVGAVSSYAVNSKQISDNEQDIEALKEDKERQIRMDERQRQIKEDIEEIKDLLKGLKSG